MLEVEIKIKIRDREQTKKRLIQLGAKKLYNMRNTDIYYNGIPNTRDFEQTDEALRLRKTELFDPTSNQKIQELHDLTYKGPKLDPIVKTRTEHVCKILEPEKMDAILLSLGFIKITTIPKQREVFEIVYNNNKIEIVMDQVEELTGWFLEAEMQAENETSKEKTKDLLLQFIQALGYSREDSIRKSYLEMVLESRISSRKN